MVFVKRGGHRDQEEIGLGHGQRSMQHAAPDHAAHQPVEIDLFDMDMARGDRFDDMAVGVDAEHAHARRGDHRRGGQADIAKADDGDIKTGFRTHG